MSDRTDVITDEELARGEFRPFRPTREDVRMYRAYSTPRLRLLAFFGDTLARRILAERRA